MVTEAAPILDAPDFSCSLATPFSSRVFELHMDARLRDALDRAGIASAEYDPETLEQYVDDESDEEPDPKLALWFVNVRLGSVEAFRRTVFGDTETLEQTTLTLQVERDGDEDFNGIELEVTKKRERPVYWCGGLTSTFHRVVEGICEGALPDDFPALVTELPPLDAEALAREGAEGASVFDSLIEDWWDRGFEIDLARLVSVVEVGENHTHRTSARWAISKRADGVRLIWPLVIEGFRVELSYLTQPLWVATRYWLTIDIGTDGAIQDVSVRTDEDMTWTAEGDPDPGGPQLSDRISETAYGAVCFVQEFAK